MQFAPASTIHQSQLLQSQAFPSINRPLACRALADLAVRLLSAASESPNGRPRQSGKPDQFLSAVIQALMSSFSNLAAFWSADLAALEAVVTALTDVFVSLPEPLAAGLPRNPLVSTLESAPSSEAFLWARVSHVIGKAWRSNDSTSISRILDRTLPVATHLALWPNATRTTGSTITPSTCHGRASPHHGHAFSLDHVFVTTPAEADPARMMWLSFLVECHAARSRHSAMSDVSLQWGARLADMTVLDAAQRKWRVSTSRDLSATSSHSLVCLVSSAAIALLPPCILIPSRILPCCAFLLLDSVMNDETITGIIEACTRLVSSGAERSISSMLRSVSSAAASLLQLVFSTIAKADHSKPSVAARQDHPFLAALLDRSSGLNPAVPFRVLHIPHRILFEEPQLSWPSILATPLEAIDFHAHHLLPFVMYALSSSSAQPDLVVCLVQDLMPKLIATRNAMIAAKTLALLLSWSKDIIARPSLAVSAFVALFKSWHAWVRTYPTLREAILHLLSTMSTARRQRAATSKAHIELELGVATLMQEAFADPSYSFGSADDAALFVSRFLDVPQLQVSTQRILVDACRHGVKRNLFDGDGMWSLALDEFLQRYLTRGSALDEEQISVIDALVEIIPLLHSDNLRQQVIEKYVYPYLPFPSLVVDHVDICTSQRVHPELRSRSFFAQWIVDGSRDVYSLIAEGIAREGQSERGVKAFQTLVSAMVRDEVETLPRSLFFGKATDASATLATDGAVSNSAPSIVSNAALVANLPLSDSFQQIEHIIDSGTFDHHLLTRHLAIPFYVRQFTSFAPHKRPESDRQLFFNSLVQIYISAEFPISKGHALLAMTAFALALHGLRDDSASEFSDFCFSLVLHQYVGVNWKRSEAASVGVSDADFNVLLERQSVNTESEELLAAVAQCLGHLSSVSGDEETWDATVSYLVGDLEKASDWAGYSRATAICMLLGNRYTTRASPPAFQVQVQSFLQEYGHDKLAFLPIKTAIGLAMGISFVVRNKPTALPDTMIPYALEAIDEFAKDQAVPLRAACASWILLHHPQGQDRLRKLFPDTLQSLVKGHITGWTQPGQAPLARLNHVVSLFSTLGFDYVCPDLSTSSMQEMTLANRFMTTILDLAGAGPNGTSKFNAAMSRVAKVSIPLLSWTLSRWCAQDPSAETQPMVGEPSNLGHMDRESSILRNAFDDLYNSNRPAFIKVVLESLAISEALPMVDWYPLLDDARHQGLLETCWKFAAARASSSYSALRYLQEGLLTRTKSALEWQLAVSSQGFGVFLALAGVEKVTTEKRGRKGAIVTVSEDKLMDVVRILVQGLFHSEAVVTEFGMERVGQWRSQFLETIACQVPDAPPVDGAYARLSRFMLEFLDLLPDLSMDQQRILVQHFVYTYSAPESLASGALTGRALEQSISITAHLVGLVAQRRSTAPMPPHLSENALLSTALHAAQGLSESHRLEVNRLLLSTIIQLIERNSLPDPKEPLSAAERAKWIARVRHQETADWLVRLLDLVLVLHTAGDSASVAQYVLSYFVLGVLAYQGGAGGQHIDQWANRLAVELEALVGHGSGVGLAIKVVKRVLLLLPRVDEQSHKALVAFIAPYRHVDDKSWRVWSECTV
ncbi:hypothetical protein BCR44DRAFT_1423508 [Catenaria anguillulae PL171]|uniref:Uncharacterized protein n=1 Tax=Catenaria anguillulae PL171 TaxID=765915 RepID=A0A1Y2I193_9FUNG|nr:hypothetical protein BCR44DRAFT_1423508 [Catenaria anguillulae PL171]